MWKCKANQIHNNSSLSSSSFTSDGPWICVICTFQNKIKNDKCEMCNSIKNSNSVEEKYSDVIKNEKNSNDLEKLENHVLSLYKNINDINLQFKNLTIENNEIKKELNINIKNTNEIQVLFQTQKQVIDKMKNEITQTNEIKLNKELELPQHILSLYAQINDIHKHILSLYSTYKKLESNLKTEVISNKENDMVILKINESKQRKLYEERHNNIMKLFEEITICKNSSSNHSLRNLLENHIILYELGMKIDDEPIKNIPYLVITNKYVARLIGNTTELGTVLFCPVYTFTNNLSEKDIILLDNLFNKESNKNEFIKSICKGLGWHNKMTYDSQKKFESIIMCIPGLYKNKSWKQLDGFFGMYLNEETMELSEIPPVLYEY